MKRQKSKYILNMDFCEIVSDKFAEEVGVKRGTLVYVAGHKALPIAENDPYTQRIKFLVHLSTKDGHIDLSKLYLMDPDSLSKVGERRQKKLMAVVKHDFEDSPR